MAISDELRKEARGFGRYVYTVPQADCLTAIAERIDAAHRSALEKLAAQVDESERSGFDQGFASADDWLAQNEDAMAEHGWVRLPVDADGVPIHVGDVMEVGNGRRDEVRFLTLSGNGWAFNDKGWVPSWSHHRAPIVEDLIRNAVLRCIGHLPEYWDEPIAECAAKLRLAGEDA